METLNVVCPECSQVNSVNMEHSASNILCTHCQSELDDAFPLDVNDDQCEIHIDKNDIPVILDFYSNYCAPCMAMVDDYEDAALMFPLKVRFLKIDGDNHQRVAARYGVGALPTLIAFKNGEEVGRISEQLTRVELTLWAERLIEF